MRERERETEKLRLWDDTSAEERYYARSMKIRMATLELMAKLADSTGDDKPIPWETMRDLANSCAQWVKKGSWDRKPGSYVTCERWAGQYANAMFGFFKLQPYGSGFIIAWRNEDSINEVRAMLAPYRKRKGMMSEK